MKKVILLSLLVVLNYTVNAQRGKDGAKNVTSTEVVNAYTSLTVDANVGDTSITVSNSNLSTNFTSNLAPGDLIMIIQVQGTTIDNVNQFASSWGAILNYNECGNYELLEVESVPNGTSIIVDCALQNSYTSSGNVVIVRVPRYTSLTVNSGDTITCDSWNGVTGGIIALEVDGITTIDAGGCIDVSAKGFRGGQIESSSTFGGGRYADNNPIEGAEKGEGIAGDQTFYSASLAGRYTRGAPANGGGGGNAHNAGGAGGSNAGNPANWNDGAGVPDPAFNVSWALEVPSLVGISNSGGGRGGYSHASSNGNELTDPPNTGAWGGDQRREVGGLGGRPLDYSTGKIFMGGAGGAGDGETTAPGAGGDGAGIIFMYTYDNINGAGNINANGQDGFNCEVPGSPGFAQVTGKDAAGGAGAGGTIIIKTTATVSGVSIDANGGNGGDQVLKTGAFATIGEAEGPGGGGGGGYIAITTATSTRTANGGIYGTTNSPYVSNFDANGATSGGIGMPNESIDAFDVILSNDTTVCTNTTLTLSATIIGITPAGAVFEWYDAPFGGNLLFTGNSFTTPSLSATTTYYVRTCPAPYRVAVTVTIIACPTITADFSSTDSTLCLGDCIDFNDLSTGSPTAWSWYFPGASTTTSSVQNPTNICYNTAGSYDVSLVATAGVVNDSIFMPNFITVNALPTITANATNTTICAGDTITLTGSGGVSYLWNNGAFDNVAFVPAATTTYTVTGTDANGCSNTDQILITVNSCGTPPSVSFSATDSSICVGDCIDFNDLSTGVPSGWTWYFFGATTTNSNNQNPTGICYNNAGSFDVALVDTNANGQDSLFIAGFITVNALPTITANATNTTICIGDTITLTGSGGTSYLWNNGAFDNVAFVPAATTTYTVTGTGANGCSNTDQILITVNSCGTPPSVSFSATDSSICVGDCIDFNDLSTGVPSGWTWYFFGATTTNSNNQNPTGICYNNAGSFDVALVDTNANGQDSLFIAGFITVNALPTITANATNTTICSVDTVTLTGGGAISYSWDNGVVDNVAFVPASTTTYTVIGTDVNGCTNTDQVLITVNSCSIPPVAALSASSTSICISDCVNFTDLSTGGIPTAWSWYFFGANPATAINQNPNNICYDTTGTFDVALMVSNAFGQDSLFIANYVIVDSCIITPVAVVIPNVFSPNGDGKNDLFNVTGTGIISVKADIYNRWGNLVYSSDQLVNSGWDGRTSSGSKCPEGTYFYIITLETINESETIKGTLTLIR